MALLSLSAEIKEAKGAMEAMKRPMAQEMNNLRKENENMNREIARLMGQIRELAALQAS